MKIIMKTLWGGWEGEVGEYFSRLCTLFNIFHGNISAAFMIGLGLI